MGGSISAFARNNSDRLAAKYRLKLQHLHRRFIAVPNFALCILLPNLAIAAKTTRRRTPCEKRRDDAGHKTRRANAGREGHGGRLAHRDVLTDEATDLRKELMPIRDHFGTVASAITVGFNKDTR